MKTIRACVVQVGSVLFDTPATLDKLEALASEASKGGAELAVFPEAYVGGYPKGHDFGAPVGSRTAEGREWFRRYYESAIDAPGPATARIGKIAAENQLNIVVGAIERDGGTLYCTVLSFAADGRLIGKRRKLMPTAAERVIWGQGDGSSLEIVDFPFGRTSAMICWENFMPMARMSQYAQGVEIWCAPTVDDRESWSALMRTVAMEGRCFVLSANQFLRRRDAPADYHPVQGDAPDTVLINGGSMIVSPMGDILAGPVHGDDAILFADLDANDITRGKMDFDVAGHYARPDVFQLSVDRRKKSPVD